MLPLPSFVCFVQIKGYFAWVCGRFLGVCAASACPKIFFLGTVVVLLATLASRSWHMLSVLPSGWPPDSTRIISVSCRPITVSWQGCAQNILLLAAEPFLETSRTCGVSWLPDVEQACNYQPAAQFASAVQNPTLGLRASQYHRAGGRVDLNQIGFVSCLATYLAKPTCRDRPCIHAAAVADRVSYACDSHTA